MATSPRFLSPDNQLRSELRFSTTSTSRFFQGDLPPKTVDVQVSIRGGAFTSNPDLITFVGDSFTVPNPSTFGDGLGLLTGDNEIRVRATLAGGGLSPEGLVVASLVSNQNIIDASPPSGFTVERNFDDITLNLVGLLESKVQGYNFYASTDPGGGVTGYFKINASLISNSLSFNESSPLFNLNVQSTSQDTDPLFFEFQAQQENANGDLLEVDARERVQIPDTVSKFETSVSINSINTVNLFSFKHNRNATLTSEPPTIPNTNFSNLLNTDPIFYTATAVYFDRASNLEVESPFSTEVVANPVSIQANIGSLPIVSRQTILEGISVSIFRSRPDISIQPGSVIRDTVIDPLTSELERLQFIIDFLYRSSSFATLLDIDDPFDSGVSLPVAQSTYKQALKQAFFLINDSSTQQIVDNAFLKLASNFGLTRLLGVRSRGEVTFFTTSIPTRTLAVPLGTLLNGGSFKTIEAVSIPLSQAASFFNPTTGRYSINASIEAVEVGSVFNVTVGQVNSGAPIGLSVSNSAPTFGGSDLETNRKLANRSLRTLSSVDTGTERGLLQIAASSAGVTSTDIASAGDPLMQRDLNSEGNHTGGKVDVWVRGDQITEITDSFAFSFEIKRDVQLVIQGDPSNYIFRILDPNLSVSNPILEMLDYPSIGYGLKNATTGLDFDLTDAQIISFNLIQLSTSVPQPAVTLTNVVLGDYRYRTGQQFILSRQPVRDLISLVGAVTGVVDARTYKLVRPYSPLGQGRSQQASNYLQLTDPNNSSLTTPSGAPIAVTDEEHVLIGEFVEFVNNLGAFSLTLKVYNSDKSILYVSPFDPINSPDYTIIEGDQTTPISIRRTETSAISSGDTVIFEYSHDENLTVKYTTNLIVGTVQADIEEDRHVTADILVKETLTSQVDITATIVTQIGTSFSIVDQNLRESLNTLINSLRPGDSLRQSDVVEVLDNTVGVSYVVLPLIKMVKSQGSLVVREELAAPQPTDVFLVSSWSNASVNVWVVKDSLSSATTDGGGSDGSFVGVFKGELEMELQKSNPNVLGNGSDRSFIIGKDGLSIPNYSDDDTLIADGYLTLSEIKSRRAEISGNRILVSLAVGDSPSDNPLAVTYEVGEDEGSKDLDTSPVVYLTPGSFEFTFDEDRPTRATLRTR